MKKIFFIPGFILLLLMFVSCKKNTPVYDETKNITLPADGSLVVNANNTFAFNFFQAALQQDTSSGNKLISPLSIYLALSMVYNGANNATKDSIAKALQLSGIDINNLNATCQALIQQLPTEDNNVDISIANSIWYNENTLPLPSFIDTVQTFYNATIQPLDFTNQASANTINSWVAQHTNNKILQVIQNVNSADLMYLINAIYFNGTWKNAFDPNQTKNGSFYLQNGSTVSAPFMNQEITTNVYSDSSMNMIELPYGGGKGYSMYVVLPQNNQQLLHQFASLINAGILKNDIAKMDSAAVTILIPSWEYSYSINNMYPELSTLGMGIAFTSNADFSNMYQNQNASITKAIHKTYIKVNEQGTEAAAVTAIGATTTSIGPPPIIFNRPFLYAIIEKQTGTVLFIGTVENPQLN